MKIVIETRHVKDLKKVIAGEHGVAAQYVLLQEEQRSPDIMYMLGGLSRPVGHERRYEFRYEFKVMPGSETEKKILGALGLLEEKEKA